MKKHLLTICILVLTFSITACSAAIGNGGTQVAATQTPAPPSLIPSVSHTPLPTSTMEPTVTLTPSETPLVLLPPQPIEITFSAADGQELTGLFYPGDANPAPVIVLMTWSRGNQSEWQEIAYWLQGRGLLIREINSRKIWKSSNWYPERTLGMPLSVFTFDFRFCQDADGCQAYLPADWLLDAQAAIEAASQLEEVDPERIITAGASIGADGAVDACAWLNATEQGTCLGSFALSPSSSLTVDFQTAADALLDQEQPGLIYCLFGLQDEGAAETCRDYSGIRDIHFGYIDNHGLELVTFSRSPDTLDYLQEFILEALGGSQ